MIQRLNANIATFVLGLLGAIQAFGVQPASGQSKPLQESSFDSQMIERFTHVHPAMGVEFSLVFFAEQKESDMIIKRVCGRIDELDNIFSDYQTNSSLARFCASAPHDNFQKVEADFWRLCSVSKKIGIETEGAFDCTIGHLSRVWRMARKRKRLPSAAKISEALNLSGADHLILGPPNEMKLDAAIKLDFGGIAKGFAADEAIKVFKQMGVTSALVDASGDIVVSNSPPGTNGWAVEIRTQQTRPLNNEDSIPIVLLLKNQAVATSGNLYQFLKIGSTRYSHIINPSNGQAVKRISAVTVMAPTGTLADAYASALSVMPVTRGIAFANSKPDMHARIEYGIGDGHVKTVVSHGWADDLKPELKRRR